jgi:hypothetical protein
LMPHRLGLDPLPLPPDAYVPWLGSPTLAA